MINILRFLATGNATSLDLMTGSTTPLFIPWNIRWRLAVTLLSWRLQTRLWPTRFTESTPYDEDDTGEWEIPQDWFPAEKDEKSDPQAD